MFGRQLWQITLKIVDFWAQKFCFSVRWYVLAHEILIAFRLFCLTSHPHITASRCIEIINKRNWCVAWSFIQVIFGMLVIQFGILALAFTHWNLFFCNIMEFGKIAAVFLSSLVFSCGFISLKFPRFFYLCYCFLAQWIFNSVQILFL